MAGLCLGTRRLRCLNMGGETSMAIEPEAVVLGVAPSRFGAQRLYRDAGSMAFSSGASAILGAAFWAVAAKVFPPQQLGVMTAILAVIVAAGIVVGTGIGDAYAALLPAVGAARPAVYRRGQRVMLVLALLAGGGAGLVVIATISEVRGSLGVAALVAVGIVAWSAFNAQNLTLISLGRARIVPAASIATNLGKIVLLPLLAITFRWHTVELAFVISAIAIVLVLRPMIVRIIKTGQDLPASASIPHDRALGEFNRLVVQLVPQCVLSIGVFGLTPFLVTVFSGAKEGALFALSLSIVQTLDLLAGAMGVSLVVHASHAPEHANAMARAVLIRVVALVSVGAAVLVVAVPEALRLLNPEYVEMGAGRVTAVLCVSSVIRVFYSTWYALQKSRRKLKAPLALNALAACVLLVTIPGLCATHGAFGGAIAVLVPYSVLTFGAGIHLLVTQRGEAKPLGRGRHRRIDPMK
jgi:O-antigen/teichoic acid export membrane protein